MNKKTLTLLLLASIALLSVAGVKVSKLTRTTSFASNDLFIVVTGSTAKVTRHIRASDLAVGLGPWITNSGGGASSVTNAISVVRSNGTAISSAATSLDFIEGTNVTLRATNAAGVVTVQINASGSGSVDPTNAVLANIIATGAMTNNWNSWVIYGSPTVSNSMFAANRGLGIVTNSTSFSGLVQSIVNRGVEGFHIEIMPSPFYSNSYSADATIIITNWGIIQGHGNPVTVIRGTAALNGPIFQVGTTTIGSGGINRFKDIRLEGDNAGVNGVGIKIVDSAEPVFRDMETTGFKLAGIELASTNYVHWAYADHCWFVTKNAGAVGILVSGTPISSDRAVNHFDINDCNFGVFGGGESINVTADFPNIRVTDSVFKYASGTMNYGIQQLNGRDASYSGNKFVNFSAATPITFAASGGLYTGVTNLNPTFVNNHSDGTAEIITLGQFVTNVTMGGNSIRGSGPTVLYEDVTSNGRISNFDPTDMRVGTDAAFSRHVTVTSNITAQSFIGSGTGVPILKLQTMMAADNAFAITVDTNYFGLTNTFNFTNMAVGQQMRVKSVSNGNPTWEVPQLISGVQTNTTSVQADWTGAELLHITNSLIANVVIIPTNMIAGRSLRVIAQASTQTYTLSVSNAAGTVVLYPFASTNGGSAYTVTNGQTVELDLMSLNGKIHAAMGRFQ